MAARAQDAPAPPEETSKQDESPKKVPPISLDDLLGLPGSTPKDSNEGSDTETLKPADDLTKKRLEEALDSQEKISEAFKLAMKEMGETADRLEFSRDTGPVTQRLQQSIIRRLEDLIKAAEQQQSSSSSSSSSQQQQEQPKIGRAHV